VPGAERLLGRGDMLYMAPDSSKLERIQGTFLSDDEINRLVRYWKGFRSLDGGVKVEEGEVGLAGSALLAEGSEGAPLPRAAVSQEPLSQPPLFEQIEQMRAAEDRDNLFDEAVKIVQEHGRGSVNLLQRRLRIGYSRAARLVDQLEQAGVLGPDLGGGRGREYLTDAEQPAAAPRQTFPHTIEDDELIDDEPPRPPKPSQIWF
jgi:S-DNA-T family DNA segregation ATPase FtsK/SpoIIIE